MFCPKCKYEYLEGKRECPDCGEELVYELTEEPEEEHPEYGRLITVLETGNLATIALAKSILEDAEIAYYVKGEDIQGLFGIGGVGAGYNPLVGPAEIQVSDFDAEDAVELLKGIEDAEMVLEDVPEVEEEEEYDGFSESILKHKTLIRIILLIIGLLAWGYVSGVYSGYLR